MVLISINMLDCCKRAIGDQQFEVCKAYQTSLQHEARIKTTSTIIVYRNRWSVNKIKVVITFGVLKWTFDAVVEIEFTVDDFLLNHFPKDLVINFDIPSFR